MSTTNNMDSSSNIWLNSAIFIILFNIVTIMAHDSPADSDMIIYSQKTFAESVPENPHFIMFFAPWCGHCKRLAPTWEKLALEYNTADPQTVLIAKVDCTVEKELCSEHGVKGYPTLKFFKPNEEPVKYSKGQRDFDTLVKYINDALEVPPPPEVKLSEPLIANQGLWELTDEHFNTHVATGYHFVKAYAPWCGHCKKLAPIWAQLATAFEDQDNIFIDKLDCTQFNPICQEHGVSGFPTLLWFHGGKLVDKYRGGRELTQLTDYVNKMVEKGDDEPVYGTGDNKPKKKDEKREKPPPPSKQPKILDLNTDTFSSAINKGFTFITFQDPTCDRCQDLEPVWEKSAYKFDSVNVKFGKVDCRKQKDLCGEHQVKPTDYPKLILFSNGEVNDVFRGEFEYGAIKSFLMSKIRDEL